MVCVCVVFTFGKERCPLFRCTFPIFTSGVVCVTDILPNIFVPSKISVDGLFGLHVAGSLVPVSYQSSKNGCDVHREDNASTMIIAYNNTSALPYTLHYVGRVASLSTFL